MQLHELNNITDLVPVTEPNQVTESNDITYGNGLAWDTPVHKEPVYFQDGSQNPMVYGIRLGDEINY